MARMIVTSAAANGSIRGTFSPRWLAPRITTGNWQDKGLLLRVGDGTLTYVWIQFEERFGGGEPREELYAIRSVAFDGERWSHSRRTLGAYESLEIAILVLEDFRLLTSAREGEVAPGEVPAGAKGSWFVGTPLNSRDRGLFSLPGNHEEAG